MQTTFERKVKNADANMDDSRLVKNEDEYMNLCNMHISELKKKYKFEYHYESTPSGFTDLVWMPYYEGKTKQFFSFPISKKKSEQVQTREKINAYIGYALMQMWKPDNKIIIKNLEVLPGTGVLKSFILTTKNNLDAIREKDTDKLRYIPFYFAQELIIKEIEKLPNHNTVKFNVDVYRLRWSAPLLTRAITLEQFKKITDNQIRTDAGLRFGSDSLTRVPVPFNQFSVVVLS